MLDNDHPMKIVVVSNDLSLLDLMEDSLDPGRFILENINPDLESIEKIQTVTPDIFVVDSTNSSKDILNTCKNIRNYSEMPILVLAAHHRPELVEQVLDAGADEYLKKPVSSNILVAYLNMLIRRARAEKEAASSITHSDDERNHQGRLLAY